VDGGCIAFFLAEGSAMIKMEQDRRTERERESESEREQTEISQDVKNANIV
jgi:hypothetical protein